MDPIVIASFFLHPVWSIIADARRDLREANVTSDLLARKENLPHAWSY